MVVVQNKILFFDYGFYCVIFIIVIFFFVKIVGEVYFVILFFGGYFNDMSNFWFVVQVGMMFGQQGYVELSDFIVVMQNVQVGVICIEYNFVINGGQLSGMWDVYVWIGGFMGMQQQIGQCLKKLGNGSVDWNCVVVFMVMYVIKGVRGLYMENVWLW